MFPPFDPDRDERKRRPIVFARGQVPVRVLIPNIFTLVGLCAGLTAIRMGIEHRWDLAVAALVFAAVSRWDRRPRRAPAQGLVALRRRARQPRRLRQFRRGAGHHHVQLGARRSAQPRLDRRAGLRRLLGASSRALQRVARPHRPAGLEEQLFRRRAGAGRRHHSAASDLRAGSRAACAEPHPARAVLYARHRAADGEQRADLLRQADRAEDRARVRAAGVRAGGAVHGAALDLPLAHAGGGLDASISR